MPDRSRKRPSEYKLLGALLIFVGVNLASYAFPVLPHRSPLLIKLAAVDLGLLLTVVGYALIARVPHQKTSQRHEQAARTPRG